MSCVSCASDCALKENDSGSNWTSVFGYCVMLFYPILSGQQFVVFYNFEKKFRFALVRCVSEMIYIIFTRNAFSTVFFIFQIANIFCGVTLSFPHLEILCKFRFLKSSLVYRTHQ